MIRNLKKFLSSLLILSLIHTQCAVAVTTGYGDEDVDPRLHKTLRLPPSDPALVLRPKTLKLKYEDEETRVSSLAHAGTIKIEASGDLYLEDISTDRDLVIKSAGDVTFGENVQVKGRIILKGQ